MCVHVYVWMCVCICVHMHVCKCTCVYICVEARGQPWGLLFKSLFNLDCPCVYYKGISMEGKLESPKGERETEPLIYAWQESGLGIISSSGPQTPPVWTGDNRGACSHHSSCESPECGPPVNCSTFTQDPKRWEVLECSENGI